MADLSNDDEIMRDALLALRDTQASYGRLLAAFDVFVENPRSGLDADPVADFDERSICMEYLGNVRRGLDDLLRMLAAVKGKQALAELVDVAEVAS